MSKYSYTETEKNFCGSFKNNSSYSEIVSHYFIAPGVIYLIEDREVNTLFTP